MPALFTVIGDMVGSRTAPDRERLQRHLGRSLDDVNEALSPAQDFEPTVGDEFQGATTTLADALLAANLVRLGLRGNVDTRAGVGHGEVRVHDASRRPLLQDGPGWWAARSAIEVIGGRRDHRRTWYVGADAGRVNAYLTCRDQLVDRLNDRGVRMLRAALLGRSQKEIAAAEGVYPSAVSQQFSRGIGALVASHALFAAEPDRGA